MPNVEKRVRCRCGGSERVFLRADEPERLDRAMRSRRWGWIDKRRACPRCMAKAAQPTDAQRAEALAAELAALRRVVGMLGRPIDGGALAIGGHRVVFSWRYAKAIDGGYSLWPSPEMGGCAEDKVTSLPAVLRLTSDEPGAAAVERALREGER